MTLNYLERRNGRYLALFHWIWYSCVPTRNRVDLWRNSCTSLLYYVVHVRCRRHESSRSLYHLLMSFLSNLLMAQSTMPVMTLFMCCTRLRTLDTSALLWHAFCHVTNKRIWWWWWWWWCIRKICISCGIIKQTKKQKLTIFTICIPHAMGMQIVINTNKRFQLSWLG